MRLLTVFLLAISSQLVLADDSLRGVIDAEHRSAQAKARDGFRHPYETLRFFGIQPDQTVVEIWPGGGWYSDILAPYLKDQGRFIAAHFNPDAEHPYFRKSRTAYEQKMQSAPELFGQVQITAFDPPQLMQFAPENSADVIVTFRNVHNWYMRGGGDERTLAGFAAMYRALKPGGILGVVDHRLPEQRPLTEQQSSGYLRQSYVVEKAEQAGFELVASSEINANPLDDANYPKGVWCLQPSLRCESLDQARLLTIGESDRMTLKFRKPE